MENRKLIYFLTACAVMIFITTMPASALSEGKIFSFHFESRTVTDALKEISAKSGVDIISNGTLKKQILKKSYVNRSLESIISDLIRGENCAVVWNYNDGNLLSIDLFTPDKDTVRKSLSGSNGNRRTIRDNDQSTFTDDVINTARANYLRNRGVNRSNNRSNSTLPASRRSVERNSSNRINTDSNTVFGTSGRAGTGRNTVSDTSSNVSANISRATTNKKNNKIDDNEPVTNPEQSPDSPALPESPEPETGSGLEPPPMPPGLYND